LQLADRVQVARTNLQAGDAAQRRSDIVADAVKRLETPAKGRQESVDET
jgi:hypothetical protein